VEDNPTVTGQFPSNYVHPLARCVYEFLPAQEGDLAMAPDDIVLVTENASEWWRVTIIQGETGRGKSSRLPHMLIQAGGPRVKMMVAQPRRTAAHSDSLMERK
jgi:hypothetical protein